MTSSELEKIHKLDMAIKRASWSKSKQSEQVAIDCANQINWIVEDRNELDNGNVTIEEAITAAYEHYNS